MVNTTTRSASSAAENSDGVIVEMASNDISDATKLYLEELIKKSTDSLLTKIDELEKKLTTCDTKITSLTSEVNSSKFKIQSLENQLGVVKSANARLLVQQDDQENYGRRMNVRIEGIPYDNQETQETLFTQIKEELMEVDIKIEDSDVVRFHRSAKPKKNKQNILCAQTILKFSRWNHRREAHYANKKAREKKLSFRIHNDLTKRRYLLLNRARDEIDRRFPNQANRPRDAKIFAYTDVNSNLIIRNGGDAFDFNTNTQLDEILDDLM